jgi:uncharacterized DUF497 family protein
MRFEFDEQKSHSNKLKHGIDFEQAKSIWLDEFAIELTARPSVDEERYLVVGMVESVLWTAVITYRDDSIRIISVRRARGKEIKSYDNCKRI